MTLIILFLLGYAIGGVSTLLLVGLMHVNRRAQAEQGRMEHMSYEIEHSAF
jgi:hypothetical protein